VPVADDEEEPGGETVILTLTGGGGYNVSGTSGSATLTIAEPIEPAVYLPLVTR
jgi:hypothetical protein